MQTFIGMLKATDEFPRDSCSVLAAAGGERRDSPISHIDRYRGIISLYSSHVRFCMLVETSLLKKLLTPEERFQEVVVSFGHIGHKLR